MYMADQAPVDEEMRSIALPFAAKPQNLNGELAGDVGFDPFKFTDKGDVAKFRVAELKHGTFSRSEEDKAVWIERMDLGSVHHLSGFPTSGW